MPTPADIVINDGETVPVAHTFEPAFSEGGYAVWEDRALGIYAGFPKIKSWFTRPQGPPVNGSVRNLKYRVQLELPILKEIVAGATTAAGFSPADEVHYRVVANLTFTLPELSSVQDRHNVVTLLINALSDQSASAQIYRPIVNLDPVY